MRYYFNGSGYTVSFSEMDASDFSESWPCSSVEGKGAFGFDGAGNLIDAEGAALEGDGDDWLSFSQDCRKYGEPKFRRDLRRKAKLTSPVPIISQSQLKGVNL